MKDVLKDLWFYMSTFVFMGPYGMYLGVVDKSWPMFRNGAIVCVIQIILTIIILNLFI